MKILLLEDIKSLGKKGEVVEAKDGYAQNFLIAKGKAKQATNEVVNRYKAEQRNQEEKNALEQSQREALARSLEGLRVEVSKKCGESGALFGAITKEEISTLLHSQHRLEVDKKHIQTNQQIKHTGEHSVSANLGNGIHAHFTLIVKAQP